MTEDAVSFGREGSLIGIISDPPFRSQRNEASAVLLLNAGLVYHIGPNRLNVKIARRLAGAGRVAMRFDFAGIGDSRPHADPTPFDQSAIGDAMDAMDYLQATRGIERFVIAGVCLGADVALQVAYRDPRVVGAVLINVREYRESGDAGHSGAGAGAGPEASSYLQARTNLRYYGSRVCSVRHWARLFTGRSNLRGIVGTITTLLEMHGLARSETSQAEAAPDLRRLMERGVRLLVVYSDGSPTWDLYRSRFEREFRSLRAEGKLRVELAKHTDHVFTLLWAQQHLVELIEGWAAAL